MFNQVVVGGAFNPSFFLEDTGTRQVAIGQSFILHTGAGTPLSDEPGAGSMLITGFAPDFIISAASGRVMVSVIV